MFSVLSAPFKLALITTRHIDFKSSNSEKYNFEPLKLKNTRICQVPVKGAFALGKKSFPGVAVWGSCGVGELWCRGVAVWGSCGVGQSRCGGVAVCGSCNIGECICRGDAL